MSAPTTTTVPFGVIAPGRPVIAEFRVIDSSKCVTEIIDPKEIDEVVFFLLPTSPIPPGHAAVLYFSVPNPTTGVFEHWEVLGAVAAVKPSGVFRTGWSTNEQIRNCSVAQLGVSIESEDVVANLRLGAGGVQDRKQFALKIAKDLFQFMSSFSQNTQAGPEVMVVPTNVLDRRESERGEFQGRPTAKRAMDSFQGSPEPTPVAPPAMVPTPAKTKDTEAPITMQTPDNVIGETLVVQGRIEFQNLLRIDGHFEGELVGNGSLIIGPTAEVISNLRGLHEVYVEGILIGDCQCNKMQIRFSGCVTGNLQCGSLGMDPSVVLKGSANVNPREKAEKSKSRANAPRSRQQRSQSRGPDEVSASSKSSGSTSVISPESLPAEGGVFDDSKAPTKQKSKGRNSGEVGDNEGGRGHGRGSLSSSSESTTSPSSTLDGEAPPQMVPPPKESGSSAAVVMPKVGDTVNMGRGRPPVFAGSKQSVSGTS